MLSGNSLDAGVSAMACANGPKTPASDPNRSGDSSNTSPWTRSGCSEAKMAAKGATQGMTEEDGS
jgi:hypothetical protein